MAPVADGFNGSATGIDPVPPQQRALGLWDTFVLWADLGISFLVMIAGMLLVPGLGLGQALAAILIGALIGNLLLALAAAIGSDTGLPTMVLLRGPLGTAGSYLPTVLNILQLIGWAAIEVIVMAQAAATLTENAGGPAGTYHAWVAGFSLLTLLLALGGPIRVTKQWLEKFAMWAVLVTTVWITYVVLRSHSLAGLLAQPGDGSLTFWQGVDLVVALPISWFPLVADYSRFATSRRAAFWGTGLGYFVPQVWFYALGVALVVGMQVAPDPNELMVALAGLTAGWLALFVLLVDETDEGFANVYSTAVSIQNLVPRVGQRALVIGISVVILVLAWLVPLTQYESFLYLIGSVFVPLLGVLAADYFVLRRGQYDAIGLAHPDRIGWPTVRWGGVVTWLAGTATYLLISGLPPLSINGLAPTLGASLPSFIVAFVLHLAVGRLAVREPAPMPAAG